ncbi:TniQ family protein [Hymenobacter wooponensis]|uniref:TniQ domain-containing protein n=1 Tax=Hymenobacter wooponensis TaxID=1525360 RepID=A0A4Z0MFD9_9BACT|nr:hypothetical protein EU557_19175 [Hymenobacter wooponensis]
MRSVRLPLVTAPFPDELLSSWLTRLADTHYTKVYTFCKLLFPAISVWNRDIDRSASPQLLHGISRYTGIRPRRLFQLLITRYEGQLYVHHNAYGNTEWVLPLGIYHRTRRRHGLLFCPGCLRRDGPVPYFRTRWRLAISIACPRCKLYLQDRCPQCEQPIIFFRRELGHKSALADRPLSYCFHCGFNLATTAEAAPKTVITAQHEWYRILRQGWKPTVPFPHLYFVVLRRLATVLGGNSAMYRSLQEALCHHTRAELGPVVIPNARERMLEDWSLAARRTMLLQASWLLEDWPRRFVSIMKQHHITSTPLMRDMHDVPFWYESVILANLRMTNENRHFKGFWNAS